MQPNGFSFNARNVDPTQGSGSLPVSDSKGWPVVIVDAALKPTKGNDGYFLELILQVIDGAVKGSTGPYRLNIVNNSPVAVDIAYKQLSALCHVTGRYDLQGPDPAVAARALFNVPFRAVVEQQKGENSQYTQVARILDINGNEPGKAGAPAAAPQAAPQSSTAPQAAPQAAPQGWGNTQPQQPQSGAPVATGTWPPGGQVPQPASENPAPSWNAGSSTPPATAPWAK